MRAPPLLVFADDWGRHPSSCQHLVRQLLPRRDVVWVNTIGTRPPRLDRATAKRAAGKVREWVWASGGREPPGANLRKEGPGVADRPNPPNATLPPDARTGGLTPPARREPRIVAPKMWPSFRTAFGRALNRRLLLRALRPVVAAFPAPPVIVTTLPLVADLIGELPAARWVYYCVDDFSVWPGYDGATMLHMERDLVPKVDTVVAVSDTLVEHVAALGKPAHLLTHGVDLDHWRAPASAPPEFAGLEPPIILFWGVIDRRMDGAFVNAVTAGTVVLVGPQEDPDPELLRLPRVVTRPPVPFARLPALAAAASVLVMPYIDAAVTHAMQPLKLKEYLATGKPAVVRDLPATRAWGDCCDLADTPERFAALVQERLAGLPEAQRAARQRLDAEGWAGKAALFETWLDGAESPPA